MRFVKEFVWWKSLFGERVCLVKEFVWWKSLFGGRVCLVKEFVWWKSLFGGRVCFVKEFVWWKSLFSFTREICYSTAQLHDMKIQQAATAVLQKGITYWSDLGYYLLDFPLRGIILLFI